MSPSESIPPPPSGPAPVLSMPVASGPEPAPGRGGRPGFGIAALLGLVAVVAAAILLIGPGGHDSAAPFAPIADAAERTMQYPGFEMTFSAKATVAGQSLSMSGSGVFNGETRQGQIEMRTSGAPGGDFSMTELVDGNVFYMQSPQITGSLPNGASWMKIDAGGSVPEGAELGTGTDPRDEFQQLQAVSADARVVATERVGDAVTTHYAATIDFNREVELLRDADQDDAADELQDLIDAGGPASSPVDVWVDRRGLVRRMDLAIPFSGGEAGTAALSMSMQLSHFGVMPKISVPPPAEVFDASGLAQAGLDQIGE